ncbi:MAG: tRNA-(ms[2]io[6]A)-hydroxylase [Cellvibrionales bacterium]|nr:MAG: tRNA-(ms[2]io[6]A)-hydroxylase [Cellvibrionales bacterium]
MIKLRYATAPTWTETVLANFDHFLLDHAGAEKKASGMAMSMALHYADKPDIVKAMIDLAIEELDHFREVVKIMAERNLQLKKDDKDVYVNQLREQLRNGRDQYFLDRLLLGAVIEARGAERFGLISTALPEGPLKSFYIDISDSEDRHRDLFFRLAGNYFPSIEITTRLDELLEIEASIVSNLPDRPTLH